MQFFLIVKFNLHCTVICLLHWQLLVLMDLFALTTWVWYLKLMHPVLESLRNTDKQWLIDTLYAFNAGNVEKFQSLKTAWGQQVSRWLFKCKWKAVKFLVFSSCIYIVSKWTCMNFSFPPQSLISQLMRANSWRRSNYSVSWRYKCYLIQMWWAGKLF